MSILIKGMEMPREKKTTLTIFADGRVYENHGERLWGHGKDCIPWKAAPVPPHGRLGDLDALLLEIKECIEEYDELDENGYHNLKWCAMKEAEAAIENAPTIIPAEEGK